MGIHEKSLKPLQEFPSVHLASLRFLMSCKKLREDCNGIRENSRKPLQALLLRILRLKNCNGNRKSHKKPFQTSRERARP